jgi:hypothetical protein
MEYALASWNGITDFCLYDTYGLVIADIETFRRTA